MHLCAMADGYRLPGYVSDSRRRGSLWLSRDGRYDPVESLDDCTPPVSDHPRHDRRRRNSLAVHTETSWGWWPLVSSRGHLLLDANTPFVVSPPSDRPRYAVPASAGIESDRVVERVRREPIHAVVCHACES